MKLGLPILLASIMSLIFSDFLIAQDKPVYPSHIGIGTYLGETPPLKDLPVITPEEYALMQAKAEAKRLNPKLKYRAYPYQNTALPQGPDAAWQNTMGSTGSAMAPLLNFDGQTSPYYPPDCNGTAGPNHYMQTVNCTYAIYNKTTGALLAGPTNMNTLFSGVTGSNNNDGDPLILYDEQANRWLAVEFSISGSNDYMMIAVSTTNDPTGTWYKYSFDVADMPDYEKFGIWQDGYYMGVNNDVGNDIYVFERNVMLAGGANPKMVGFDNPFRPTTIDGFMCVPPVDNDGPSAPAGSPGLFITINDDAIGGGSDQLWIYELAVNWTNTASSTFSRVQQLNVTPFDSNFGNTWANIPQPGTSQKVDAIPMIIMNPPQYRNFGDYQTIVCCHTVDLDATNHAGIRWYELRKPGTGGSWTIRQQGTYGPDGLSRWMGSIMLNGSGKIGLGYSVSSSTVYPGIRFAGQSAGAYTAASGILDVPEDVIYTGAYSQTGADRWGDYSQMCVDPSDNETFWYTNQYIGSGGSRRTRIASFKIGNAPVVATLAATNITGTSATVNGTVNPNGLSTTYYFQWGTTLSYGNSTTVTSAGSGTGAVSVNATLSSLTAGVTYHYRIVATNADGTSYGNDFTFTPGAASVTTASVTNIGLTTATGGGEVVSDGGSPVTARGVCWSTTTGPTTTGSHTTDGSGTGIFTSSLTGLTSSTTYYVRAYATNSSGTYYGNEVQFTTSCGVYTLPFSQSFSGTTIPTCWSNIDNQGNGQVWQFGTITGYSPNPNLTGNYAYLNSDGYGSGSSQNADLVTPTIDMTGFTNVTLQFSHYFRSYTGSSAKLYYSINNGASWTLIQTWTSTTANPATFNQVISAVGGQSQVKFKWNYTGSYGYYWAVDNIQITGTATGYTLSVSPSNQNVAAPAGSTSFNVTSNTNWTAVSDAAWCTVSPSGSGNGIISANYTENTGVARIANITVTVASLAPVVVTVTQSAPSPALAVTPANQNVTAAAGNTSFTVTSNSSWTVNSNSVWCTVPASGLGNGNINASYTENTALNPRQAMITVTVTGLSPITVTVTQAGAAPALSVSPPSQNVPENNGSASFTVTSNIDWTAVSDAAWCTVTPSGTGNGNIIANYSANPDIISRTANITVSGTGVSPVIVAVVQAAAAPVLSVTPPNQNIPWQAGSTSFNVYSNTSWSASSNASWCTITPGGTGSGSIAANCTENTSTDPRTATLTVTGNSVPTVFVTVTQAGTYSTLSVAPLNQNVAAPAGSTSFSVTSNTSWTASSNTSWCSCTSSGVGNGTLTADFSENTSTTSRISYLSVVVANLDPFVVTVTQAGALPTLSVTPQVQSVTAPAGSAIFTVFSNSSWTASSNQNWCTVTPSGNMNGEINAVFSENLMAFPRSVQITVTVNGIDPVVVTLNQEGAAPYLTVSPPQQTVTYQSASALFNVSSNAGWSTFSDAQWCSVTASGAGNGNILANYSENTSGLIRTANISVTVSGLAPQVVQLVQLPSFVSISDKPASSLRFYPNPTSGIFIIAGESQNNLEIEVTVMDPLGNIVLMRKLQGQPSYTLDISNAAKGNYYIKVDQGGKVMVWKLILQ